MVSALQPLLSALGRCRLWALHPGPLASSRRRGLVSALVAVVLLAAALPLSPSHAADRGPPVLVVVNRAVEVDDLSLSQLREIALGRQRFWRAGQRVELIIAGRPGPERRVFVEKLAGMSEIQFQQHWIGQVFRARATSAPRAVPDRQTTLALVGAVPGAIAFVTEGPLPQHVKVISIDGKDATSPSYPFR
ncbi:MAG: hypothetical protein ACO3JL_16065 [Myxococcota bacterium]